MEIEMEDILPHIGLIFDVIYLRRNIAKSIYYITSYSVCAIKLFIGLQLLGNIAILPWVNIKWHLGCILINANGKAILPSG